MFELDVKNAFIYGDLEEEVHMEQSPGNVSLGKNMVCKLYGLKQHLWAWFDKFSCIICELGFQKCYCNHFVFIHKTFSTTVIFAIYVDILLTQSDDGIKKAKEYLKTHFVIKS